MIASIIPLNNNLLWYNQYLVLLFFTYLIPVVLLWKFNKYLSLVILTCVFSTFFTAAYSPRAMLILTQFEALALVSYMVSKFNFKQRKNINIAFLGIFILQLIMVTAQLFNKDPFFSSIYDSLKDFMVGFMGSPDQLGSVTAIINPIVMSFGFLLIIPALFMIGVTKSSFALLACIVSVLFLVYFNYKKYFKKMVVLCVLLGVFFLIRVDPLKSAAVNTRTSVWKHAISAVVKGKIEINKNNDKFNVVTNPLFGYGFGNFLLIFPYVPQQPHFNYIDEKFTHAHNDFVEFIFETGLLGAIVIFALLISIIIGFIISIKSSELVIYFGSLIAYIVNMNGNFISHIAVTGLYLAIIYGMYEGVRRELNGKITTLV
jgi:hypothetical protein